MILFKVLLLFFLFLTHLQVKDWFCNCLLIILLILCQVFAHKRTCQLFFTEGLLMVLLFGVYWNLWIWLVKRMIWANFRRCHSLQWGVNILLLLNISLSKLNWAILLWHERSWFNRLLRWNLWWIKTTFNLICV